MLEENKRRSKGLVSDLSLDKVMLQDIITKKLGGLFIDESWWIIC